MKKPVAKLTEKWRKTPEPKTVRAKYQQARRVKFKSIEIVRESDYINGVKQ